MNLPEPTGTAPLAERYRALLGLGRTFLGSSNSRDLYQTIYIETAKVVDRAVSQKFASHLRQGPTRKRPSPPRTSPDPPWAATLG